MAYDQNGMIVEEDGHLLTQLFIPLAIAMKLMADQHCGN
jgi:hypothetical protein